MAVAEPENQTEITELYLMGFVGLGKLQVPVFYLFLLIYLATMVENILIIFLVVIDSHLHTPMYFFLGSFSFLEMCYSSNILPMMLTSLIHGGRKLISVTGCIIQYYLFGVLAVAECCLLTAMSYDRYVAICKPLYYRTLMNDKICLQFIIGSWIHGLFVMSIVLCLMHLLKLKFCGPSEINHFFCELNPILKLACSETYLLEFATTLLSILCILLPFLLTLASYIFIISTIMKTSSVSGRKKAFSTCSSHLVVVFIFYSTLMIVYILPKTDSLKRINKIVSLFYTILPPLFNPLIYSLRNREVIEALRKTVANLYTIEQM
ncbi:olfactory receptor 10AG1-like [Erythrolamprus reginae]|uniref:olfactory receptor 10AG1-like n=1 Tax=Erythrolamprus reginae TaxID=121349 RepID=UPI00396C2D7E